MRKKIFTLVAIAVFSVSLTDLALACGCSGSCGAGCGGGSGAGSCQDAAQACGGPPAMTAATTMAVNVGNVICPVRGEKINEKTKVLYEHEGKVYNLCCAGCVDEFKKDPSKYVMKGKS